MTWPTNTDAPAANPRLMQQVAEFRSSTRAALPGRLAQLIEQHFSADVIAATGGDLSVAEQSVQRLAEWFHLDAHGITDDHFASMRSHYGDADVMAIMMQLALVDGFAKFDRVFPDPPEES